MYKKYFKEDVDVSKFYDLLDYKDLPKPYANELLKEFFDFINIKQGKAPKGKSNIWQSFKKASSTIDEFSAYNQDWKNWQFQPLKVFFDRMTKEDIDDFLSIGTKKSKNITEMKLSHATYFNESNMAQPVFLKSSKEIDGLLGKLKNFHKKVIQKPLVIKFKRKDDLRSKAVYKQSLDEIWIRGDYRPQNNQKYGSVPYVIIHELGHRYLKLFRVNFDYDSPEWITTPYSKVDSMTGEEKFAELFALSFFNYSRFPEYKPIIEKFEKIIGKQS